MWARLTNTNDTTEDISASCCYQGQVTAKQQQQALSSPFPALMLPPFKPQPVENETLATNHTPSDYKQPDNSLSTLNAQRRLYKFKVYRGEVNRKQVDERVTEHKRYMQN